MFSGMILSLKITKSSEYQIYSYKYYHIIIHNTQKRPLLNESDNVTMCLEKIWEERRNYYKSSSHHTIDTNNMNPEQVSNEILNLMKIIILACPH